MQYLVFSDLHASQKGWEQLCKQPVFADTKKVCLGDVIVSSEGNVDYYQQVATHVDTLLLGNHEAVLVGKCPLSVFNPKVHEATSRITSRLESEQSPFLEALQALPMQLVLENAAFTHGSFNPENPWKHIRYIEDLPAEEPHLPRKINFFGHGHIPFIAWKQDGLWFYERQIYQKPFILNPELTYIINCGSILGSREMRWHERTCVLYDAAQGTVQFVNVSEEQV